MNRVMVVEDERLVACDIAAALTGMGYDVTGTAASVEECLLSAQERRPDIVLMDINLAGTADGVDAAVLLREHFDLPVIYLTAYADHDTLKRAKLTAPLGYVVKPYRESELRSAVEVGIFRQQVERQLQERERWFASTINAIGDGVIAIGPDCSVLLANPAAESLLRTSFARLQGRPCRDILRFVDESTLEPVPNALDSALERGETIHLVEGTQLQAGGVKIPVEGAVAPIVDEHQRTLGAVMIFQDITEKRTIRDRAAQAERLAALGTLAAGVGHEINNPLTYVMGNVLFATEGLTQVRSWLRSQAAAESGHVQESLEDSLNALREINEGAERISTVVGDLRSFVKRDGDSAGDVNEAVRWALRVAEHSVPATTRLAVELGDVPQVHGSATRVGQLLLNLVINAIHAIREKGDDEGELYVATDYRVQENEIVITVRDSGCGMDRSTLKHAFEPFFTTKPMELGTGMGLFICSSIARDLGGRLEAESEVGRGSTFTVRLPACSSHPVVHG
jgi:PAS domain S-box-containing protein